MGTRAGLSCCVKRSVHAQKRVKIHNIQAGTSRAIELMSTYRLKNLLSPRSVALVGASPRQGSVGRAILGNIHKAKFKGEFGLVNSHYAEIDGVASVGSLGKLPFVPELVVITAPAAAVAGLIDEAGARGAAGALIITSGLGHGAGSLADAAERAAHKYGMRLIGPNCLGIMMPGVPLNASFSAHMPVPGNLALISQSGAIATGMVDWAAQRGVGFSGIVSIGDQLDVDIADLLDYFALDGKTRAILLYVEAIKDARKFMSAARAAARIKPVVVVKSGRMAQGAKAAATHTGALAGSDAVYDAAFRRAGILRVSDLRELFDCAETLGRVESPPGKRLAMLTNGGGIGVLAVDRLVELGESPRRSRLPSREKLDAVLPPTWSGSNPVDIVGDADAARYAAALEVLLADPGNDAILVMNVQTAIAPADDIAATVTGLVSKYRQQHQSLGQTGAGGLGRRGPEDHRFAERRRNSELPYRRRRGAGFHVSGDSIARWWRSWRRFRRRCPASLRPISMPPGQSLPRRLPMAASGLTRSRSSGCSRPMRSRWCRRLRPPMPSRLSLTLPRCSRKAPPWCSRSCRATSFTNPTSAASFSISPLPMPCAEATAGILARAKKLRPEARISGVIVQAMVVRPKARELILGLADDPTFGTVIVFGRGGTAVEVINDKALALPPLDLQLARDLIERTRVSRLLRAYRDVPAVKPDAVAMVLVKLAQMAADIPEIRELDINPLLADESRCTGGRCARRGRARWSESSRGRVPPTSRCGPIRRNGSGTLRSRTVGGSLCAQFAPRTSR